MENLTPEQKKQLASWASQRDTLLLSIAENKVEEERLINLNKSLSKSATDIADRIQQSIGRLEELMKKEDEFRALTTSENAALRETKSQLQTEVSSLNKEISILKESKATITETIAVLTTLHDKVFDKINGLESIVAQTTKIASDNANEVKNILIAAGAELQKVVDAGERNVEKTNRLILDIPKIIVDLHRNVMERRIAARNRIASNGVEPNQK